MTLHSQAFKKVNTSIIMMLQRIHCERPLKTILPSSEQKHTEKYSKYNIEKKHTMKNVTS